METAPDRLPIFVITGQLSAGKTTVARALLDRYSLGFHIDVDAVREMVSSGLAGPLEWTDETSRQFALAVRAAAALARVYADAGFAVAIEGGIEPAQVEEALAEVGVRDELVGVVLHPNLGVALERNRRRQTKAFDTSILEGVMADIDRDLRAEGERPGWHRIDNGHESVDATVERILQLAPPARTPTR